MPDQRHESRVKAIGPSLVELPAHQVEQFDEIRIQRAVQALLDAEVVPDRGRGRFRECLGHRFHVLEVHARVLGVFLDGNTGKSLANGLEPDRVRLHEAAVLKIVLHDVPDHGREQKGVAARPHGEVDVGQFGRFSPPRIDDEEFPAGILRSALSACRRSSS